MSTKEKIFISGYPLSVGETFRNKEIVIDRFVTFTEESKNSFYGCKFIFLKEGSASFRNCHVENCFFQGGGEDLSDLFSISGIVDFDECKIFRRNKFIGRFERISINKSLIEALTDNSDANEYLVEQSNLWNFIIKGSCRKLYLDGANFFTHDATHKSVWSKEISINAVCKGTIFGAVKLDPFYLSTKCKDKSSLDISQATLIDHWSRLRKKYAGISLFIVFVLTFLFFLPLFTHSFFLLTVTKINRGLAPVQTMPLWEALLFGGKDGIYKILYSILTVILLLYNIGRLYMTISIAKLREEEIFLKDSNFNLVSIHPEKYKNQLFIDKWLSVIFWISIGYTLLKLVDSLMIAVPAFS